MRVPIAEPGDYLVSMTVDGQTYRQTLRVERTVGGGVARGFAQLLRPGQRGCQRRRRVVFGDAPILDHQHTLALDGRFIIQPHRPRSR